MATLVDEVGIDVASHVSKFMTKNFASRIGTGGGNPAMLEELVSLGMKGRKSGRGLFVYPEGVKERNENLDAIKVIDKYHIAPKKEYVRSHPTLHSEYSVKE